MKYKNFYLVKSVIKVKSECRHKYSKLTNYFLLRIGTIHFDELVEFVVNINFNNFDKFGNLILFNRPCILSKNPINIYS